MNVHILFESNDITNGRVVGVFTDPDRAKTEFALKVLPIAGIGGSGDISYGDELWSYMPDDTEDHKNISVALYLDCEVTA